MTFTAKTLLIAAGIGVGATAFMDLTAEAVRRTRGVPPLDYRLVGRWVGHMPRGTFTHASISSATPVPGERALGWATHYAVGVTFALALVAAQPHWIDKPAFAPAVTTGLLTITAPWFIMQPAFGMGIAAAKTPFAKVARLRSARAHLSYGLGLWLCGLAAQRVILRR